MSRGKMVQRETMMVPEGGGGVVVERGLWWKEGLWWEGGAVVEEGAVVERRFVVGRGGVWCGGCKKRFWCWGCGG